MKKKMVFLIGGIVCCVGMAIGARYLFVQSVVDRATTFIVGTTSGYAPYVSLNERGEYEGFDIDCARALAQKLKKKLIIKDLGSMAPLLLALEQKSIDAIMWGMSITKERTEKTIMVHYQGSPRTTQPLVFWKSVPAGITSLGDLCNRPRAVVAYEPASSQARYLSRFQNIEAKPFDRALDMVTDIKYGKSMAALIDPGLMPVLQKRFPELVVVESPLNRDEWEYGVGVMLNKQSTDLACTVESAVKALKESGFIAEREKVWGLLP